MKTKDDLIETVIEQIKVDVHCGEYEAIGELLEFSSIDSLIFYLPESDWKKFKHLRDDRTT
jgi:hypothetical protein